MRGKLSESLCGKVSFGSPAAEGSTGRLNYQRGLVEIRLGPRLWREGIERSLCAAGVTFHRSATTMANEFGSAGSPDCAANR
ncbi:MAG TPA: hypothetical protein VMO17_09800 [Terriglobia bacterium]|nr:hypothetical protein [Terriglobia bacterium]